MTGEEANMNRRQEKEVPPYTLGFPSKGLHLYTSKDEDRLGKVQQVETFETEHHLYKTPFRYKNVKVENWLEYGEVGIEMAADIGTITIVEEKPIVSVTIVGSGCSGKNYNIVEWWGPGESITRMKVKDSQDPDWILWKDGTYVFPYQRIKRQRIDNLKGQHNAWTQSALTQEPPKFKSVEEATTFIKRLQTIVYNMTSGYYMPGSLMTGLYENTAYFRIGDMTDPEDIPYKVVIRGGGLDYEDPGTMFTPSIARYPADYAFRLIDIVVKKSVPS